MQCEYQVASGQCSQTALDGSRFCVTHTPNGQAKLIDQYLISQKVLGDAPSRHAGADEIKSLRIEIALLRALIEKRINICDSDAEMVAAMPLIKETIVAVEKLVSSCHAMETKLGQLLNKSALMSLAQKMVHTIDDNLQGIENRELIVEKIGNEIVRVIAEQQNE